MAQLVAAWDRRGVEIKAVLGAGPGGGGGGGGGGGVGGGGTEQAQRQRQTQCEEQHATGGTEEATSARSCTPPVARSRSRSSATSGAAQSAGGGGEARGRGRRRRRGAAKPLREPPTPVAPQEVRPPCEGGCGGGAGDGGGRDVADADSLSQSDDTTVGEDSGCGGERGWLRVIVDLGTAAEWDGAETAARMGASRVGWRVVAGPTTSGEGQVCGSITLQQGGGERVTVVGKGSSIGAATAAVWCEVLALVLRDAAQQVLAHVEKDPEVPRDGVQGAREWLQKVIAHTLQVAERPTWEERHAIMVQSP